MDALKEEISGYCDDGVASMSEIDYQISHLEGKTVKTRVSQIVSGRHLKSKGKITEAQA